VTSNKIRAGATLFEAQRNGDVTVLGVTIPHLDTIRVAYWLLKVYVKSAAKRADG
jgi:hypothetical protein